MLQQLLWYTTAPQLVHFWISQSYRHRQRTLWLLNAKLPAACSPPVQQFWQSAATASSLLWAVRSQPTPDDALRAPSIWETYKSLMEGLDCRNSEGEGSGKDSACWNIRKCSAAGLDVLSTVFGEELLPLVTPIVRQRLQVPHPVLQLPAHRPGLGQDLMPVGLCRQPRDLYQPGISSHAPLASSPTTGSMMGAFCCD